MLKSVECERCDEINEEDDTKDHDGKTYCYDCHKIVSKNKDIPNSLRSAQMLAAQKGGTCLSKKYKKGEAKMKWSCGQHEWYTRFTDIKRGKWCARCAGMAPLSLEECKLFALNKGGECLSTEYKNGHTRMQWNCGRHVWMASFSSIKQGKWCAKCAGKAPLSLEECQLFALDKGGKCLSAEYINCATLMEWSCGKHKWKASFGNIKQGTWCAKCARKAPLSLEECQSIALNNGGKCLSTKYINAHTQMKWSCGKHEWFAPFHTINRGSWCAKCAGNAPLSLEECQSVALNNGGKCLSTEYVNCATLMEWSCGNHQWLAPFSSIKQGAWCAKCTGRAPLSLDECQKFALDRGGECLSTKYINNKTCMVWSCGKHQWKACFGNIKNSNQWCPHCPLKSETKAREIMEEIMQIPFYKEKPKWLKGLELDGYNEDENIAFEYQGEQHYKHMKHWHRNGATLEDQQKRDRAKVRRCERRGVILIVIPYTYTHNDPDAMYEYIDEELDRQIKARVRKARQAQ